MNKVAVISCGPSWREFMCKDDGQYDIVIGCNWIAERIICDWVVAHDAAAVVELFWPHDGRIAEPLTRGNPNWFLHWHALDKIGANRLHGREDIKEYLKAQHVMTWPPSDPDLPYTGLAALRLLHILSVDKADLYGYDMYGRIDGRGQENDNRPDERWQRERKLFDKLVELYGLQLNMVGSE